MNHNYSSWYYQKFNNDPNFNNVNINDEGGCNDSVNNNYNTSNDNYKSYLVRRNIREKINIV